MDVHVGTPTELALKINAYSSYMETELELCKYYDSVTLIQIFRI
jgi:hypothetical protein